MCGGLYCSFLRKERILVARSFSSRVLQEKLKEVWEVVLGSIQNSFSVPSRDAFLPLNILFSLSLSSL